MDPQDLWIQITGKLQVIKPRPLKSIIEVFVDQNDVVLVNRKNKQNFQTLSFSVIQAHSRALFANME